LSLKRRGDEQNHLVKQTSQGTKQELIVCFRVSPDSSVRAGVGMPAEPREVFSNLEHDRAKGAGEEVKSHRGGPPVRGKRKRREKRRSAS